MSRCGTPQELQQAPMQGHTQNRQRRKQQQGQTLGVLSEPILQRILALVAEADKRMLHTAPLVCRAWCTAIMPPRELRIRDIGQHRCYGDRTGNEGSAFAWLHRNGRGGTVEALTLNQYRGGLPALDAALLPSLRSLTLSNTLLLCESADAVALHLPQLEVLAVRSGALHPGAATALARLTNLRSLSLQGCHLHQQDVNVLAGALTQLTRLDIEWVEEVEDADGIAALTGLRQLADLSITGISKGRSLDAADLASVLTGLTRLALSHCQLEPEDLSRLATLTRLRHLDLNSNPLEDCFSDEVLLPLIRALTQLTCLCMGFHNFDFYSHVGMGNPAGIQVLKYLTALVKLDVSEIGIGAAGAQQLAGVLPNLASLSVRGCGLGPQGLAALAAGLNKLTYLNAEGNDIGGEATSAAAVQSLTQLQGLRHLNLGFNCIGLEACMPLTALTDLTYLGLWGNVLHRADKQALRQCLTPQASQVWRL